MILSSVRDASRRPTIAHDNDAIANINRVKHRRQHTDIGLESRDNQGVPLYVDAGGR